MRRFVLLDRDGTIVVEKHHLTDPDEIALIPGAGEGLRTLAERGLGLALITNQSVIGRGLCDRARVDEIHRRMSDQLSDHAVQLDGIYVCPHRPDDGCVCRKPRTGLVEAAAADLHFTAEDSFVVGDSASDVALGRALGATTFLVRTGHGHAALASGCEADHVVDDLAAAAAMIAGLVPKRP